MLKKATALAMLGLLGACASQSPESENWTRWVCDNQEQVLWRLTDPEGNAVDVRLGDSARVYHLTDRPAGSGALYSDGVLSFHTKGDQGMVYWTASEDLIGLGCEAP